MSLRWKIILPFVLFSALLGGYLDTVWLPGVIQRVDEQTLMHRQEHLKSVAEGLVPLLLENQLATVYSTLDSLLESNKDWLEIELINEQGRLIYPLGKAGMHVISSASHSGTLSDNSSVLSQSLKYKGTDRGDIWIRVDTFRSEQRLTEMRSTLRRAFILVIIAVIVVIIVILELVVKAPLTQLANAANALAKGDFAARLPTIWNDEVGMMVSSFTSMRDAMKSYQNKLERSVDMHRRTAEALYTEKERVTYQASHDALTGLINRFEFERKLKDVIHSSERDAALLYIDLDQFKVVNDTSGHLAGDELLKRIAIVLNECVPSQATVARLGGDEFGLILQMGSTDELEATARNICAELEALRFIWEGHNYRVTASIGIVYLDEENANITEVMKQVDSACYSAKELGRNRIYVYRKDDLDITHRMSNMRWVARITEALENNKLTLFCQPIVPVNEDDAIDHLHYELLLRMQGRGNELILPGAFLSAAEQYGLAPKIDRWVIEHIFSWLGNHPEHLQKLHLCAINLSGQSLSDESFLDFVRTAFSGHDIPAEKICFEITETAVMTDLTSAHRLIDELKDTGVRFALDDFGTGLSSFAYLKSLPVDYLKIDGVFVRDILRDPIDREMVRSINEVAHIMGIKTIAEFVEDRDILSELKKLGVDQAQGYGVGKPIPLDSLEKGELHIAL
ncbi:MAG TPA: EAL domain-containing protein [Gammaproteobacteria bacterium]|nr:EAL domain-containing protein [Gammaproteobacteria bacterium]